MTDEQIKQNAEKYADALYDRKYQNELWRENWGAYIAGAHSRDEEIYDLKRDIEDLQKMVKMRSDAYECARKEIDRLSNQWISVKDHLPEMFVDSKDITHDFSIKVLVTDENNPNYWHVAEYYPDKNEWCCLEHPTYIMDNVTHWMPISNIH